MFQTVLFVCRPRKSSAAQTINLIYKPDAIGDFLLASGIIRELIARKPGPWVLICSPQVKELARHLFPDLELLVLEGSNRTDSGNALSKIKSLRFFCRSRRIETLVCLRHSLTGMDHVLLNWLNPKNAIGTINSPITGQMPGSYRKFSFHQKICYPASRGSMPMEISAHLAVVNVLMEQDLTEHECKPFFGVSPCEPNLPPELAVFPVTRSRLRNYPLDPLSDAVNHFLNEHPEYTVRIYGTKEDTPHLNAFAALLNASHTVTVEYPSSILDAAERIHKSTLVLGMDSAPAHIAIILDKPGVFILAGAQFDHFAPWTNSENQVWLFHKLPCYMCNWSCIHPEPVCITRITPGIVSKNLCRLANNL